MGIDASAMRILPFREEAIEDWSSDVDVLRFLLDLCDKPREILLESGELKRGSYREYGQTLFEEGVKEISASAQRIKENSLALKPKPASAVKVVNAPALEIDPLWGHAGKYVIAWRGVVSSSLSSTAFFSLPHVLEAEADLSCCLDLTMSFYYRQSFLVLRSMLESLIASLYFSVNPAKFDEWRAENSSFRLPRIRGKNGICEELVKRSVIDSTLDERISRLYGWLSGSVHGSERTLLHKGLFSGRWRGQTYDETEFHLWCSWVSEALDVGLHCTAATLDRMEKLEDGTVRCDTCHGSSLRYEDHAFGGREFRDYTCLQCGSRFTRRLPDMKRTYVTIYGPRKFYFTDL